MHRLLLSSVLLLLLTTPVEAAFQDQRIPTLDEVKEEIKNSLQKEPDSPGKQLMLDRLEFFAATARHVLLEERSAARAEKAAGSRPVMKLIASALRSAQPLSPLKIRFRLKDAKVDFIDCDYEYSCYCQKRLSYSVQRADEAVRREFRRLIQRTKQDRLFACRRIANPFRYQLERRCSFMSRFMPLENRAKIALPSYFDDLSPSSIIAIWVEASVRTDDKGVPLGEVLPRVRPVWIETDHGSYTVRENLASGQEPSCSMEVALNEKIIDLSGCSDSNCYVQTLNALRAAVVHAFSLPPLEASLVMDQPIPPGEIWLRRAYKPSLILGRPYFELTTYVLQLWPSTSERPTPAWDFMPPTRDVKAVYLNVSQSITTAVGVKGTFSEPSEAESRKFKEAVSRGVRNAVVSTCERLKGHVIESSCSVVEERR